jgi:hypothetical protein
MATQNWASSSPSELMRIKKPPKNEMNKTGFNFNPPQIRQQDSP